MEQMHKVEALQRLLDPEAIAIVGASDRSFYGRMALENLRTHGFEGRIVPVNARAERVQGLKCFPSLDAAPPVDVVVSAVPREHLIDVVAAAGRSGAAGVVVLTSGLAETLNPYWVDIEARAIAAAEAAGMVLIGPNGLGVVGRRRGAYAWGSPFPWTIEPGGTALIMQSGGLLAGTMAAVSAFGVGISHAASIGNGGSVGVADWLRTCHALPDVSQVGLLLDALPPWAELADAVRALRGRGSTVYALKTGRSVVGARAAATHTGALIGSHAVAADLMRQLGIQECMSLGGLTTALALGDRFGAPKGTNLAVLTASGGAASLVADACADRGIDLRPFTPATQELLADSVGILEPANPLDVGGQALSKLDEFTDAVRAVAADPTVGAVLYVPALGLPDDRLPSHQQLLGSVDAAMASSGKAVIVTSLTYSDAASAAIGAYRDVRSVLLAPNLEHALDGIGPWLRTRTSDRTCADHDGVAAVGTVAADAAESTDGPDTRTLDEQRVKDILSRQEIPVPRSVVYAPGETPDTIPFRRSVLKGISPDVMHKSKYGMIALDLTSIEHVRDAERSIADAASIGGVSLRALLLEEMISAGRDLFLSISDDPIGTIITLGLGGTDVEERRSVAFLGWPAADRELADFVERAVTGLSVDQCGRLCALIEDLARIYLAEDLTLLECNPVRVSESGLTVLDALATSHPTGQQLREPAGKQLETCSAGPGPDEGGV